MKLTSIFVGQNLQIAIVIKGYLLALHRLVAQWLITLYELTLPWQFSLVSDWARDSVLLMADDIG